MINLLRIVKNSDEIEYIKKAQDITDKTFSYLLSYIEKGRTEKDIALAAELFMRKNGSEGIAFDIISVSGKNSSLPHGEPTDKRLEKGDFLTIDMGSVFLGYCSDMTRTVAIGSFDEEQELVYNTVLLAQISALNAIKEGVTGSFVDKIARDIITNAGFGDAFGHGLGHGVGVEIHETPRLAPSYDFDIKARMVVTVEPGIYIKDSFGVRIEDLIVVTKDGCENLTKSSKELIVL